MTTKAFDVLVLGAGFAGSLTALLLQRIGKRVALVDHERHPRFVIGESSTPLADLTLKSLADRYNLEELKPLTAYGTWKRELPQLTCGLKRGFSYFRHQRDQPFSTTDDHDFELLVTASVSDEVADTHWLRSDVDAYFAAAAERAGVTCWYGTWWRAVGRAPWKWQSATKEGVKEITAEFVVDATGSGREIARVAGVPSADPPFRTHSRAIYAHYEGVPTWESILAQQGISRDDYPFPCDAAAVHHLLDEGWMWQLRFENGVTSVGLVYEDASQGPTDPLPWFDALKAYPSLKEQMRDAEAVVPRSGLIATRRLQRLWPRCAGRDWVMLPSSAGFVDPLHSTGIAHALTGIERLVALFEEPCSKEQWWQELERYEEIVNVEFDLIDRLVACCYATRNRFSLFVAATMLYFVAAITCETRRLGGMRPAFLNATDEEFTSAIRQGTELLRTTTASSPAEIAAVVEQVREWIAPWNTAGLLDPQARNLYRKSALPMEEGESRS